jgi:Astacin (Peptidase family M12A)
MAANPRRYCIPIAAKKTLDGRKAALLNAAAWPQGAVIKVAFMEGDSSLKEKVKKVASRWTGKDKNNQQLANLTLNFVNDPNNADIRIAFQQGDGSWSYIGTECRTIAKNEPTMNYGWLTKDSSATEIQEVVLHEFGHALGLIHEHQNPAGAIQWNKAAVKKDLSGPPNRWDDATIQHNIFDKYDPSKITGTPVDKLSIMMYPIPAAWTTDGFSSGFNTDLSAQDESLIRTCYP